MQLTNNTLIATYRNILAQSKTTQCTVEQKSSILRAIRPFHKAELEFEDYQRVVIERITNEVSDETQRTEQINTILTDYLNQPSSVLIPSIDEDTLTAFSASNDWTAAQSFLIFDLFSPVQSAASPVPSPRP